MNGENTRDIAIKAVFDMFIKLKKNKYGQYNNYIIKIELRKKNDGSKTLYVESADPLQIKLQ